MNRLKYAFGINVPHTVLSQFYLQEIHGRRHSNVRPLRSSRWNTSHSKRFLDSRNVDNGAQQRVKSGGTQHRRQKSITVGARRTLLSKNILEKCVQNRCRSSCQVKKLVKEHCDDKRLRTSTDGFDYAKSTETNTTEPEAGSYAHIIAMYSEALYSKSVFVALKDSTSYAMVNRTHRSPFSPASMISTKPFHTSGSSLLNQEANFSTETSVARSDFQTPRGDIVEAVEGTETIGFERVSSYAAIIDRYSNTVSLNVDARGWVSHVVPRRHVSTKLDNLSLMLEDTRYSEAGAKEMVECSKKSISEVRVDDASEKREVSQAAGYIIKDPERIAAKKDDIEPHPLYEQADWLDRVVGAHKKGITDRKLAYTGGKTPEAANEKVAYETSARSEINEEHPRTEMSANKPSNPISEYIRRGPVNSSAQRGQAPSNASSQSSATVSNPGSEPRIELRMTPSHNESVVAINVDELSARTAGAKDHLSVVISSKKNASNAPAANTDAGSDFGSMQISISEDTVPVKQIEFSINGKPVSELKSILARADKLDVLSSMDKVEIRIPSKDNHARTANQQTQQVARAPTNPSAILNLHINAKFNGPRVQQPKDAGVKPDTPPPIARSTPPNQAPIPPRSHNIFSPTNQGNAKPDGTVATNMEKPEVRSTSPEVNTEVLATTSRKTSFNVAENLEKDLNRSVNSGANQSPRNAPQDTTTKIKNPQRNNPVENRVPSNMIPWWSSEEAFNKIKKKGIDLTEASSVEAAPNRQEDVAPKTMESVVAESKKPEVKTESTSQPSAVASNPAESPKTIAAGKDAKKSEVAGKSSELLDVSAVRVTSSQRYVHAKAPKFVKQKSRITKKVYRARNVVTTSAIPKRSSDTRINSVPPPKVVKFVAVKPRTVDVEGRPVATSTSEKQGTKVEEETKKLENVQKNSDTVIKGADFERSANRSAGVSAARASAADESGSVPAKGKPHDEISGTVKKGPADERVFDRRITEILKTMKPIEKRKDGTLIDYGVTVPSRKPLETVSRRRSKSVHPVLSTSPKKNDQPTNVEPEKATKREGPGKVEIVRKEKMSSKETKDASNQSKVAKGEKPVKKPAKTESATKQAEVVDPVKISSVKKETLTEPKAVTGQTKIVEPVKISSVKKVTASEDNAVPGQSKSDGLEKISLTKRQTNRGPNNIPYVPRSDSEHMLPKKQSLHALGDSRAKGSATKIGDKKSVENVNALATSDSKKLSDVKAKVQNVDTPLKPKDSSKSIRESPDKKESRVIILEKSETGSRGALAYNSKSVAKKPRIHSSPPVSRTVDRKSENVSPENLNKHFKETGFAPFKGTIRHEPPKSSSAHVSNTSEEKKATPKKGKSESGGGSTGFGNSPIGPAGLKSSRSFMMHTITSIDNVTTDPAVSSMKKEHKFHEETKADKMINEQHSQPYLEANERERPEKGLLYASWLQRFKNSVDDDKML